MKAEIEVLHPGLFSTIQDMGRNGFLKYGVPLSGVMDIYSAKMANMLLQNPAGSAVLEITQMGPKLKFSAPAKIAITGADLSAELNKLPVNNNQVYQMETGDIISFGKRKNGCRAYLAIKGGFKTEKVLKSRSWFEGITENSKLKKGSVLVFETSNNDLEKTSSTIKIDTAYLQTSEIEVFPGPEYSFLDNNDRENLNRQFSIDHANNRMAIQLQELLPNKLNPIITGPVLPGTVQLTPSGKLIILMRDCQTTGGYPRILQLTETGINILAQKVPGDKIMFGLRKVRK